MPERNPFFLIKIINDKFEAKGNNECQKAGLTLSQFRILDYLNSNPDRTVTQREMELKFQVSHPTINGILGRMEEKRLITTNLVREGKQQKQVFITAKGNEALNIMFTSRNKDDKALFRLFTPEELNQFEEYLNRVVDYLA